MLEETTDELRCLKGCCLLPPLAGIFRYLSPPCRKYPIEDIQRAKHLRDQATTVAEYRKALCVILPAELSIDADQTAELLGNSATNMQRSALGMVVSIS
ncbi:MAG: hypothetical protein A2Z43_04085 [Syntrophobacterales bacterium RBG_19FT_COMBO_59_10]|nr:MAG: hypothetical protein A2Z43_04085 [Syntrophobacterales bacterium RBG_19FT_COMBO_59_10]